MKEHGFWFKLARVLLLWAVSLFVVAALGIVSFSWWMHSHVFSISKFDPVIWFAPASNETESSCYRGGMAHDIIDRLLNGNMTNRQVESLLGKPEEGSLPSHYTYTLGMCSGFRFDYDTLDIYFNDKGTYVHATIIQH